jgi:hypothetical protein
MAYRRFVDRSGDAWEIRDRSRWDWTFEPVGGNAAAARTARAPGYQDDPFELSDSELQKLLDAATGGAGPRTPSPFLD